MIFIFIFILFFIDCIIDNNNNDNNRNNNNHNNNNNNNNDNNNNNNNGTNNKKKSYPLSNQEHNSSFYQDSTQQYLNINPTINSSLRDVVWGEDGSSDQNNNVGIRGFRSSSAAVDCSDEHSACGDSRNLGSSSVGDDQRVKGIGGRMGLGEGGGMWGGCVTVVARNGEGGRGGVGGEGRGEMERGGGGEGVLNRNMSTDDVVDSDSEDDIDLINQETQNNIPSYSNVPLQNGKIRIGSRNGGRVMGQGV